jgi:hypothetical protein
MPVQDRSVRADDDHGVEQRGAAELAVQLVDPDNDRHAVLRRGVLQWLEVPARQVDGVLAQARVDLAGERAVLARLQPPDPGRVAGNVGLGKDEERGALRDGFLDRGERDLDRLRAIEQDRRLLNNSDL